MSKTMFSYDQKSAKYLKQPNLITAGHVWVLMSQWLPMKQSKGIHNSLITLLYEIYFSSFYSSKITNYGVMTKIFT